MTNHVGEPSSRASKIRHEFEELAYLTIYLFVCFGAINLYKIAALRAYHIDLLRYGAAAIKALLVAKFVLIGRALHVGEKHRSKPLAYYIAIRVALFALLVFVLSLVEEIVVAFLHGRTAAEGIAAFGEGGWLQITAECILLCLILAPYMGLEAIGARLGPGALRRMFFSRQS